MNPESEPETIMHYFVFTLTAWVEFSFCSFKKCWFLVALTNLIYSIPKLWWVTALQQDYLTST